MSNGNNLDVHFAEHERALGAARERLAVPVQHACDVIVGACDSGNRIIAFGNGGSAAEASHFAGELLGRFSTPRRAFAALALASDPGVVTCIANDFGFASVFERQIGALARAGDVCIGFSTSGRSENVLRGLRAARQNQARTIALTGMDGLAGQDAEIVIAVPSSTTAIVQEIHLMIIHVWCRAIDDRFLSLV